MKMQRVVLIGGSGFVGRAVANRLTQSTIDVLVPTRRASRARDLITLPTVEVVEANVHDEATLRRLLEGADGVVNLVGVLHSRSGNPYGPDFARAHVELPKKIVAACRAMQVPRLVHFSALGASPTGPSEYQRSKAAGEEVVRTAGDAPAWTILRPSVIFGRDDNFLNLFARLVRRFPVLPLPGAHTLLQPVYVGDVADVVWRCLLDPSTSGEVYELAGPHVRALHEVVEYVAELEGRHVLVGEQPEALAMLQARLMELSPSPIMSRDNVRSLRVDNIASGAPLPFGMTPTAIEAVAPSYIGNESERARYYSYRTRYRHDMN